jgi:hypothetical protein
MSQQEQQRQQPVATRDGSRWLHYPPNEEQVREWFATQPLHAGMDHGPYLGGIVVIGATEKVKISKWKQNGDPYITEVERAVFIPYVKVDTRIAYFHDLVSKLNEGEVDQETEGLSDRARSILRQRLDGPFVGVIEPVPQKRITDKTSAFYNEHLPEGFSVQAVRNKDDSVTRYIVATFQVAIYERESWHSKVNGRDPVPLLQGVGSKQSLLAKTWADDNSMMKAETGAIGRALGVAGILVVGTGVATAEDVQEAQAGSGGAAAAQGGERAELPPVVDREGQPAAAQAGSADPGQAVAADETPESADEAKRQHALALQAEMERDHPDTWEAYKAWWADRGFGPLSSLSGPALNGAVIKLERDLDAAKTAAAAPGADA